MGDSVIKSPRWMASPVTLHAVQCARCMKWRIIPTKKLYEAIREHILEEPWVCESASSWRSELRCDLPADIKQDRTMLWAIDKPNLPSAPVGWERQITVRTDGSSKFADVYYLSPQGAKLRSKVEIEKYISGHPGCVPPKTTMNQFSFAIPRPLPGLCPYLTLSGKKLNQKTAREERDGQGLTAGEAGNGVSRGIDHAVVSHHSSQLSSTEQESTITGDGNVRQLFQAEDQGTQLNKRRNPDLPPTTTKRTKQQIKMDRKIAQSPVRSLSDQLPVGASTSSVIS